jgi:hypothetical protein
MKRNIVLDGFKKLFQKTYLPLASVSLIASSDMAWPQGSLIGGLEGEDCCLRIGQENTE